MDVAIGAIGLLHSGAAERSIENELVRRCKERDPEAFGKLLELYQARVYGFVRRMVRSADEAEDIAQEVFVKAFQNISKFDGRASFSTWLFKIASNLCIDKARRHQRRPEPVSLSNDDGDAREVETSDLRWDPQNVAVVGEMERAIEAAIASLSEKLRGVLLLHDLEGLSYDEIATTVGVPVGTVKSRLFLARAHLQAALSAYLKPEEAI